MGHGTMTCPFKPHLIFPTAQFPHSWSWTSTPSRNRKEKCGRRENGREKEWGHNLYPAGISPNFENEWMLLARDWKKTIILPSDCLVITNKHVLETLRFPEMISFKSAIHYESYLLPSPPQERVPKDSGLRTFFPGPSDQSLRPGAGNSDRQLEEDPLLVCLILENGSSGQGPHVLKWENFQDFGRVFWGKWSKKYLLLSVATQRWLTGCQLSDLSPFWLRVTCTWIQ